MAEIPVNPSAPQNPATPNALEPQVPATKDTSKEKVAPSIQLLVQREKKALELEQRAKRQLQEAEAKAQGLTAREAKIQEFENLKASGNYTKALELLGLSYGDLTTVQLNDGNLTPELQIKKVDEKLDSFLKSQEEAKRVQAEELRRNAETQEAQAVQEFKDAIKAHCESDSKKYELINFEGQQMIDMAYSVVDEHYNRTIDPATGKGQIMPASEAADRVEKWLRETKYAKATELDFFKTKLAPPQPTKEAKQELTFRPPQTRTPTLTNNNSATPVAPRARPRTDDERIAAAIAYAKGLRP